MDMALWIAQFLLAFSFISVGYNHATRADKMKEMRGMQWIAAVPRPLFTFIGICEIAGGLGVVLPALSGIQPWLTPLAAALLAAIMLLAFIFHVAAVSSPIWRSTPSCSCWPRLSLTGVGLSAKWFCC